MRTALLAAVSHDLRTPLASIKASVSTLRQTDVEWTAADEAALLATIEDGADRLDALIGNLLDMSRLATGSLQPFLRPHLGGGGRAGRPARAGPGQQCPDRGPGRPAAGAHRPGPAGTRAGQPVLQRAGPLPAGQPPELRAGPDGDSVRLAVCDHGPGVPDEFKLRMFEPFERLGDRAAGNGRGPGLAVAKGFLEAMGGTIHAADTPGGG